MRSIVATVLFLGVCWAAASAAPLNGPAPSNPESKGQPPQQITTEHPAETNPNQPITQNAPLPSNAPVSQKGSTEPTQHPADQQDKSPSDWWLVGLTAGLVVVGSVQCWVFWIQASRLRQTILTMEGTAERQLRAYVSIEARNILRFEPGKPAEITVIMENAGQTPAYDVQTALGVYRLPYPLPRGTKVEFTIPDNVSKTVIHPQRNLSATAAAQAAFSQEDIENIKAGTICRMYVGGIVKYVDAFKKERCTAFLCCAGGSNFASAIMGASPIAEAKIAWEHTREHNKAT